MVYVFFSDLWGIPKLILAAASMDVWSLVKRPCCFSSTAIQASCCVHTKREIPCKVKRKQKNWKRKANNLTFRQNICPTLSCENQSALWCSARHHQRPASRAWIYFMKQPFIRGRQAGNQQAVCGDGWCHEPKRNTVCGSDVCVIHTTNEEQKL